MQLRRVLTFAIALTCGLGLAAAPAGAHDPSPDDLSPYTPSGFFDLDWSGFYAGGHLGLQHTLAESDVTLFPGNFELFDAFTFGESETSVIGGIQGGWQRQWGKMVAGVELGFDLLRFRSTSDAQALPGLLTEPLSSITRTSELSDIFLFTGRVGYADGRWLAYAKGGLANAQIDVTYRDAITGFSSSSGGRENGWIAGIGIDYALTHDLFLGIEYDYLHFSAGGDPPPIPETTFGSVNIDTQSLVVRLNYRFNTACCGAPGGPGGPP